MRRRTIALLIAVGLPLALVLYSFLESRRMPVVREATIGLPDWPKGAKPVTAVLIADIHIGNASMEPERLNDIVDQINALRPDLVLIAGDFIAGHQPNMADRVADGMSDALARLTPPLGTVAVLGNHDLWTGITVIRDALARAHVTLLSNEAVERGPIAIAGIDDHFTGQRDIDQAWGRVRRLPGARVALSHSPDIDYGLPKDASLLLAGHSHCGQVALPFYGPIVWVTRDRNRCGLIRQGKLNIIVTAGLGTSGVPFRLSAPPDLWMLHLGPVKR